MKKIGYGLLAIVGFAIGFANGGCMVGDQTGEAPLSYAEFKGKYIREIPETGAFVYDDDQTLATEEQVQQLYDAYHQAKLGDETLSESQVNRWLYGDDVWPAAVRQNLTYCVSNSFGSRKATVVSAMAGATKAWTDASAGKIKFVYRSDQDASCTATNTAVQFNTVPSSRDDGSYATAFFPNDPRKIRQVIIYPIAFQAGIPLPLVGILRHELGHALGLRHETNRPEAFREYGWHCFEDVFVRRLTAYDESSVMTTPACMGDAIINKQLTLSSLDVAGIRALYK